MSKQRILNQTPVLLIAFNRPGTTQKVFDSIKKVQPKKLYVAVDGPRPDKQGEDLLCKQVVKITKQVDWDCETNYLIRKKNLGCKNGVSGAITWAFENEDRLIIIEDDIIAVPSFFDFANEMLEMYKDDLRIAMISANNYTPINAYDKDYLFSNYGHIWGWATWKRTWDKFDVDVPDLEEAIDSNLNGMSFVNIKEKNFHLNYFKKIRKDFRNKTVNAWGPQFFFFRQYNNLLSIVPKVNLASNIGVTSSRTDAIAKENKHYYPANSDFIVSKYPNEVEFNYEYDYFHFKKHINRKESTYHKLIRKVLSIVGGS